MLCIFTIQAYVSIDRKESESEWGWSFYCDTGQNTKADDGDKYYTCQHTKADDGDKYYTCQHTKTDDEDIDVGGQTAADAANTAQQTACH